MPVSHAQAEVSSLLEMLAGITDPRDPRGIRHRLLAVLGVAVVATMAGAANYRELGSVAADLPQRLLHILGARWDRARHRLAAPSAGTLRRVLIGLDADELDAAVGHGYASTRPAMRKGGRSRWTVRTCGGPGAMTAGWCCSRR